MRLHVGVLRAEELLGAIDRQLLDLVGVLAAAVVALARIAFGVLVGEDRAHGFEDRFGNEILRGDQLQAGSLASGFVAEEAGDLRIDGVQRPIHAVVGVCGLAHSNSSFARPTWRRVVGGEAILSDGWCESQFAMASWRGRESRIDIRKTKMELTPRL